MQHPLLCGTHQTPLALFSSSWFENPLPLIFLFQLTHTTFTMHLLLFPLLPLFLSWSLTTVANLSSSTTIVTPLSLALSLSLSLSLSYVALTLPHLSLWFVSLSPVSLPLVVCMSLFLFFFCVWLLVISFLLVTSYV